MNGLNFAGKYLLNHFCVGIQLAASKTGLVNLKNVHVELLTEVAALDEQEILTHAQSLHSCIEILPDVNHVEYDCSFFTESDNPLPFK